MAVDALFSREDLEHWLQEDLSVDQHAVVERVVWGWLSPVLGTDERPDVVSPALFAASLELGAIAKSNPDGLLSYQLGEERSQYGSERRDSILDTVGSGGSSTPSSTAVPRLTGPRYSRPYPDPACAGYSSRLREPGY